MVNVITTKSWLWDGSSCLFCEFVAEVHVTWLVMSLQLQVEACNKVVHIQDLGFLDGHWYVREDDGRVARGLDIGGLTADCKEQQQPQ